MADSLEQSGKNRLFDFLESKFKPHFAFFSYALIVLESLLLLFYSMSPAFLLLRMRGYDTLYRAMSTLHLLSIPSQSKIAAFYSVFGAYLLHFFIYLGENSFILAAYHRIGSIYVIEACINILFCETGSITSCYNGIYNFHVLVAGVVLASSLIQFAVFSIKWDRNPFHRDPCFMFTNEIGLDWLVKLALKVTLPILFVYMKDPNGTSIGLLILYLGYLLLFKLDSNAFNRFAFELQLFCDSCNFWLTVSFIIENFNQGGREDLALVPALVATPFFAMLILLYHRWKVQSLLKQLLPSLEQENDLFVALYRLACYSQEDGSNFVDYVILHAIDCNNPGCRCKEYLERSSKTSEMDLILQFIQELSEERLKSWEVKYLQSCIYLEHKNCAFRALHNILFYKQMKISVAQEYSLYTILRKVKKHVELMEMRQRKEKLGSYESMAYFNESVLALQNELKQLSQLYINFYKELLEQKPIVDKLIEYSTYIEHKRKLVSNSFKALLLHNKNHPRLKRLYSIFFDSFHDDESSLAAPGVDGSVISLRVEESSEVLVISITIFGVECGTIRACNDECRMLLGYRPQEIMDQHLSKIQPPAYHAFHADMLERFLERENSSVTYKRLQVVMLKSNGYVFIGSLFMRIMPTNARVLDLFSFTRGVERNTSQLIHYLIIDLARGCVAGLSQSFEKLLRIAELRQEQIADLVLEKMFPVLSFRFDKEADLSIIEKVTTKLDLAYMLEELQQFFPDSDESQQLDVFVDIESDFRYKDYRIAVIKLSELSPMRSLAPNHLNSVDEPFEKPSIPSLSPDVKSPEQEAQRKKFESDQKFYQDLLAGVVLGSFLAYLAIVIADLALVQHYYGQLINLLHHMYLSSEQFQSINRIKYLVQQAVLLGTNQPDIQARFRQFQVIEYLAENNASLIPALYALANTTGTGVDFYSTLRLFQGEAFLFFSQVRGSPGAQVHLTRVRTFYSQINRMQEKYWTLNNDLMISNVGQIYTVQIIVYVCKLVWALVLGLSLYYIVRELVAGWNAVLYQLNNCTRQELTHLIRRSTALHYWLRVDESNGEDNQHREGIFAQDDGDEARMKSVYIKPIAFLKFGLLCLGIGLLYQVAFAAEIVILVGIFDKATPALKVFNNLNYQCILLSESQNLFLNSVANGTNTAALSAVFSRIRQSDQVARSFYQSSFLYDGTSNSPNLISKHLSAAQSILLADFNWSKPELVALSDRLIGGAFFFINQTAAGFSEYVRLQLDQTLSSNIIIDEAVVAAVVLLVVVVQVLLLRYLNSRCQSFLHLGKMDVKSAAFIKLNEFK